MNSPLTFKPQPFGGYGPPFSEQETWEVRSPYGYESEGPVAPPPPPPLAGAPLGSAVAANREHARRLGWGCVVGGQVRPVLSVLTLLALTAGASEEDIARAVAEFQLNEFHRPGDGQLGPDTWRAMLRHGVLPTVRFKPASWPVFFNGERLGLVEKTAPYNQGQTATHYTLEIQTAFRVTNLSAVTRAGFVDSSGAPQFRWIQVIELRRIGVTGAVESTIQKLRKRGHGFIIDPTAALLPLDPHPYYWYESSPPSPGFHISNYLNKKAPNGLCYDLIFYDQPTLPFTAAQPGKRAYFNFETALVGVRPGKRNVLLNTFVWGFDIINSGGTPQVGVNVLGAGPTGGSPAMHHVLGQEIAAGVFPGHCFVGPGFSRGATCV